MKAQTRTKMLAAVAPTGKTPFAVQAAEQHPHVAALLDDGARDHTEPTTCHLYPGLCTSIDGEDGDAVDAGGRHIDHSGSCCFVPGLEVEGDPEIWAEFTHLSGGTAPHIGFMGHDLTPDQAHEKADQLRKFADDLDELAHQTHVARGLFNLRQARETADPAFAEVLTIMEKAIVEDGADPSEVGDEVLRILRQVRAEQRTELPA